MSDSLSYGSNYNPWDLDELAYEGELYHYTNANACIGIFGCKDCPDFPPESISLRFTRIDCMTQNDQHERQHMDKAVKKIAKKMAKSGQISSEFLGIVCDYVPTNNGFYRLALDERDNQFHKPIVLLGFGPVDYYVACFSTNPNNKHITREFKTSVRITFNESFAWRCADPFSRKYYKDSTGKIRSWDLSITYPLQSIRECFPDTYLRRVEYIDTSANADKIKSDLIEEKLINIYKEYSEFNKSESEKIQGAKESIEDMYSLCDAFIKDIKYKPEEEVRFVIRLPQRQHLIEINHQFPKLLLSENHFIFDKDKTYLQLPISTEFVTL